MNERSPVIEKGLAMHFLFDGTVVGTQKNTNLIHPENWVVGTQGSQPGFTKNGDSFENEIILFPNPWGRESKIWATLHNDISSAGDGGFVSSVPIDNTKTYRTSVWIRRENIGNGRTYLGCRQTDSVCSLTTGTLNTNPYNITRTRSELPAMEDNWLLWVAYTHPHDYVGGVDPRSGIYNLKGEKINSGAEFKFIPTATYGGMRTYLYYSTSVDERHYWSDPRYEMVTDSTPSIEDLIAGRNTAYSIGSAENCTVRPDSVLVEAPGQLCIPINLPDDFTISCTKRDIFHEETHHVITKSGDVFTYYKDGTKTTQYANMFKEYRGELDAIKPTFDSGGNPFAKGFFLERFGDFIGSWDSSKWNEDHWGGYFRYFIYIDVDVNIDVNVSSDNYSYLRVNNDDSTIIYGSYTSAGQIRNLAFKAGWNLVEYVWTDGDSGGAFYGDRENVLASHPNVKYITAELPIDMIPTGIHVNRYGNPTFRNFSIYDHALTADEVFRLAKTKMSLRSNGDLLCEINENENSNLWPNADLTTTTYGVDSGPTVDLGADDHGTYHQCTGTGSTIYKGFDIPSEVGETYIFSGQFWASDDGGYSHSMCNIEGSSKVTRYFPGWGGIPFQEWVPKWGSCISDGNIRCLIYPSIGTATYRWRNICVRKATPNEVKLIKSGQFQVGEFIEV